MWNVLRIPKGSPVDDVTDIQPGMLATHCAATQRWHYEHVNLVGCCPEEDSVYNPNCCVAVSLMRVLLLLCELKTRWKRYPQDVNAWWVLIPYRTLFNWASKHSNTWCVDEPSHIKRVRHGRIQVRRHPLECLPVGRAREDLILPKMRVSSTPSLCICRTCDRRLVPRILITAISHNRNARASTTHHPCSHVQRMAVDSASNPRSCVRWPARFQCARWR
mmetsp:Transcript_29790/g.54192  ORF Transcript_29790/g.54192 Transcript_29790/m.54192 type:complete len:219 (+) Transcript_29790:371-1027(+)